MNRPKIICHMVTSIDGKVTGDFLLRPEAEAAAERYYEIHRAFQADAFACGRVTMEESFTGGWYPDLSSYMGTEVPPGDYAAERDAGFYAVAFDRKGRLGWQEPEIRDEDPGYDRAHIIEVLTPAAKPEYLAYLRRTGVSYVFAGSVGEALDKLADRFGIRTLLLEGGSDINGAFAREGLVDELSLVQAPLVAGEKGKPLFGRSPEVPGTLTGVERKGDALWLRYACQVPKTGQNTE